MTPRNLSLANLDAPVNLSLADTDCITANAEDVRAWLLGCAGLGTLNGLPYTSTPSGTSIDAYFREGSWLCRAIVAFARTRSEMPNADASTIAAWLAEQATYMAAMIQAQIGMVLPGRAAGDYTQRTGYPFTPAGEYIGRYIYQGGPEIPRISRYYNNRRGDMALAVYLAGQYLDRADLRAEAIRYIKEWVIFCVYPDGEVGEFDRDDDYGNPDQGHAYAATMIGVAIEIASREYEAGRRELLDFKTRDGHLTTLSPDKDKTIFTAMHYHLQMMRGQRSRVNGVGNPVNIHFSLASGQRRMHWTYWLAPLARLGLTGVVGQWLYSTSQPGVVEDVYYADWRGLAGIYPADIRPSPLPAMGRL